MEKVKKKKIDWATMLTPFAIVIALMVLFMAVPAQSKDAVDLLRDFFGNTIGIYYPLLAMWSVRCTLQLSLDMAQYALETAECLHTVILNGER